MNEHQLAIGETTWGGRPELESGEGIDYGSLIYIALERCKTAREAIKCMTDLVAEYGYASSGEEMIVKFQFLQTFLHLYPGLSLNFL